MKEQEDLSHDSAFVAGTGLLSPATMAKITQDFILALEPELLLRQFCGTDKELVKGGGDTRRFRKLTQISESQISQLSTSPENSTPSLIGASMTPSYVDAIPEWWGISELITYQSIKKADYNAVNIVKTALVKAWARFVDKKIRNALLAVKTVNDEVIGTNVSDGTPTTVTLANPNVYKINSITTTAGTVTYDRVNYVAGKVRFTVTGSGGTNTIKISYDCNNATKRPSPLVIDAATKGKLGLADILNAKVKIASKNGKPKVVICYDEEMADLLSDQNVVANMAYDQNVLFKGTLTKLYGLEVLETNFWYPGVGVVLHPGAECLMYVVKEPFGTLVERKAGSIGDMVISLWEAFDVICLNDDLVCVINNCQSDAYAL